MYRARDAVDNRDWVSTLEAAADELSVDAEVRATARDLFLSAVPDEERSKPVAVAASLYAASLITGDRRSQRVVADAVGVSRLAVQRRWKGILREAGFEPPSW